MVNTTLSRTYKCICPICKGKSSGTLASIRRKVCIGCEIELKSLIHKRMVKVYERNVFILYKIVHQKLNGDMNMFNYIKNFL